MKGTVAPDLEAVYVCEASGHIQGSLDTYIAWLPWTVAVAVARQTHFDIYNASANVVRIRSIAAVPDIATAVTGVGFRWEIIKTTSVGTGGTGITPRPTDSAMAALAGVTVRQKPTGGAATDFLLHGFVLHLEETHAASQLIAGVNLLREPVVLRANQGLKVDQITNSLAGNIGFIVSFTVES